MFKLTFILRKVSEIDNKINIRRGTKGNYNNTKDRKIKKVLMLITIAIILIGVSIIAFVINMPNKTVVSMQEYRNMNYQNINIILEDKLLTDIEHFPLIIDEQIHMPVDFISNYVDENIYWEPHINLLTITNLLQLIRIEPGSYNYVINFEPFQLSSVVHNINSIAYLPLDLIHDLYDVDILYNEELNIVIVDFTQEEKIYGSVISGEAAVRHEPDKKSPISKTVYSGDTLRIFDTDELTQELYEDNDQYDEDTIINIKELGYTSVRTDDGFVGYILTKDIEQTLIEEGFSRQPEVSVNKTRHIDGPINMTWDLLTIQAANNLPRTRIHHEGLNVISPTWLSFDRETYNGDIINISNTAYVQWAHEQGYQVWPLLFDYEDPQVTNLILSDTFKRDYVIIQLMELAEVYNLDGFNIDFEGVRVEDSVYYLQFLRELSPMMRENNLMLSVSVFVPAPWTMFYNRTEIARVADYLTVMAYDENVSGGLSGPNASISFVETAIVNTLNEVPNNQIILGVPFYTRIWREVEVDGEVKSTVRSVGMQFAHNFFTDAGADIIWLEDYGSYYSTFTTFEDDELVTYSAYIEDERSIERKVQLANEYNLRGVASWSRGLETPETWNVISNNLNR